MAVKRRKTLEAAPPAPAAPGWRALLGAIPFAKLALELFVVFIGVSAAFWLEEWRQDRRRIEDARAVYSALADEVRLPAKTAGPPMNAEIEARLAAWRRQRAAGERPALAHYVIDGARRPPTGVWDAAVSSGTINLIGPHMTYCLARFYNRLKSVGDIWVRYDDFTVTEVIPYLDDPAAFYDARGALKPQYFAHVQQLERYTQVHDQVIRDAQALMPILERGDPGAPCPLSE